MAHSKDERSKGTKGDPHNRNRPKAGVTGPDRPAPVLELDELESPLEIIEKMLRDLEAGRFVLAQDIKRFPTVAELRTLRGATGEVRKLVRGLYCEMCSSHAAEEMPPAVRCFRLVR